MHFMKSLDKLMLHPILATILMIDYSIWADQWQSGHSPGTLKIPSIFLTLWGYSIIGSGFTVNLSSDSLGKLNDFRRV